MKPQYVGKSWSFYSGQHNLNNIPYTNPAGGSPQMSWPVPGQCLFLKHASLISRKGSEGQCELGHLQTLWAWVNILTCLYIIILHLQNEIIV
jgi:hypothetical protein